MNKKDKIKAERQRQKTARERKANDVPVSFLLKFPLKSEKDSIAEFAKTLGMSLNVFTLEALRFYKSHRENGSQ